MILFAIPQEPLYSEAEKTTSLLPVPSALLPIEVTLSGTVNSCNCPHALNAFFDLYVLPGPNSTEQMVFGKMEPDRNVRHICYLFFSTESLIINV